MNRVAAIDCGTNSIRLLIADYQKEPAGEVQLREIVREIRMVRLGEGVDHTGRLSTAAIRRTRIALVEYRNLIDEAKVGAIRFVATSAMRDAHNGEEMLETIRQVLGVEPETIPGSEEAVLSFQGALSSFVRAPSAPTLVVDVGGGSTEFVVGTGSHAGENTDAGDTSGVGYRGNAVGQSISVNMGSVRVTERFHVKPGAEAATAEAARWVDRQLDRVEGVIDFTGIGSLVGVAGTVTTLSAWALGADEYDPERTHGQFLTWDQWEQAAQFMMDAPVEEKAALNFMAPGRADVIGAGALIWDRILQRVQDRSRAVGNDLKGAFVSEHDVLDGIALSIAHKNC